MFSLPKVSLTGRPAPKPDRRNELALWLVVHVYTL